MGGLEQGQVRDASVWLSVSKGRQGYTYGKKADSDL